MLRGLPSLSALGNVFQNERLEVGVSLFKPYRILLSVLVVLSCIYVPFFVQGTGAGELLRVGIFADLHAHDTNSPLEKLVMVHYRERLSACIDAMNAWPADLVIQMGDFVNGRFVLGGEFGDASRIPGILEDAESIYAQFEGPRYYIIGNHDVEDLSKTEFLALTGATESYLSFDAGAYHFVVLDAQYNLQGEDLDHVGYATQGYIPSFELDWLREDLAATDRPTIVCVHQRLDVEFDYRTGGAEIANFKEVRDILEDSGVVIAVFQGHDHDGAYSLIEGIHYLTFRALIDRADPTPPSWAYVTLDPTARAIEIEGEGEQVDYRLQY
jgi:3',5'-cyclic AMP phosphodiesterase CpdA